MLADLIIQHQRVAEKQNSQATDFKTVVNPSICLFTVTNEAPVAAISTQIALKMHEEPDGVSLFQGKQWNNSVTAKM